MKKIYVPLATMACLIITAAASPAGTWVESSQADFSDGDYNANVFTSEEGSDSGSLKSCPGAFFDLNKDGRPDLVISNMHDNSSNFNINSYIYWGKHDWTYSADSCLALPTFGATGNSVEDLNRDGHLDILFSSYSGSFSIIYWGSKNGFSAGDTSLLQTNQAHGNYIADLNNDGRLDIVFANQGGNKSYIYWGDKHDRKKFSSRTELTGYGSSDIAIADLDKDGILDIVIPNKQGTYPPSGGFTFNIPSYLFYGQKTGDSVYYDDAHKDSLMTHGAYCVSVGDIDKNGWLDIVFSNVHDGASYNIRSYIYFGSDTGFTRRVDLPTCGAIGNNIVDLDKDGNEDVIFANWYDRDSSYSTDTHDVPTYVYWGPDFGAKTDLPSHGAHGAMVGKISSNNVNDVLITNSVIGAGFNGSTFHTWSYIYHGVGRTGYEGLDSIPSYYGHISTKDNGNVHDRGQAETYRSSVFGNGADTYSWGTCSWESTIPAGSSLQTYLRTGNTTDPEDGSWSTWSLVAKSGAKSGLTDSKYCQYRFAYASNDYYEMPVVDRFSLDYNFTGVEGGNDAPVFENYLQAPVLVSGRSPLTILYGLASPGRVKIGIYDIRGCQVSQLLDKGQEAGQYRAVWNGKSQSGNLVSSGVYFCRMLTRQGNISKKIIVVK